MNLAYAREMNTDSWIAIGIWVSGPIFGVVGFLILRELKRNDDNWRKNDEAWKRVEARIGRHATKLKILEMVLKDKRLLPHNLKFPSPEPGDVEDAG